ncbi:MAG: hypothetical protein HYY06_08350 [Deltaproteobacteria bacterium]|nr:hypothetical protein [Deltaproteobacteria bacterium]
MRDRGGAGSESVELLLGMLPGLYAPGSPRGRRVRLAAAFRALTGALGCRIVKAGAVARSRPGETIARIPLGTLGTDGLEAVLRFRGRAPARSAPGRAAPLVPHARRLLGLPEAATRASVGSAEVVERLSTQTGEVVVLRAPLDPLLAPPASRLAPRERAVCLLASEGLLDREIAEALGTSPRTVANQLRSASRKLDAGSRREVAALLARSAEEAARRAGAGKDEP